MFEDRGPGWEQLSATEEDRDAVEQALNEASRDGRITGSQFNRIYFNVRAAETLGDLAKELTRLN